MLTRSIFGVPRTGTFLAPIQTTLPSLVVFVNLHKLGKVHIIEVCPDRPFVGRMAIAGDLKVT